MDGMDISPCPVGTSTYTRCLESRSTASTPGDLKRMREDDPTLDWEAEQLMPPSKQPTRMAVTPTASPRESPVPCTNERHSISAYADCHTPLAAMPADSMDQAQEMGVRWAMHQRLGPRR